MIVEKKLRLCNKIISLLKVKSRRAKDIAELLGINEVKVQRACLKLVYAGILRSKKGRKGGYSLKDITPTVKHLMLAVEVPILFTGVPELESVYKSYLDMEL
jgi:DNA-binding IscR family transcriptional regulator